jgi:hypothetical protein
MWDERVNRAIDEVARQMTEEAQPASADFRRRVLAQIASNEAPRASWRAAFVLSPIAVAAAIVIIVMFVRTPGPFGRRVLLPGSTVATVPSDVAGPKGPALQITDMAGPKGPVLQIASGPVSSARRPGPLGPGASRPAPQLDPIEVDSIAVAPLAVGMLSPDPIQIERLDTIAPMTVAPLDIPDVQRRFE